MIRISANYSNGHSLDTRPPKNKTKNGILVFILLHIYVNLWLKIPKFYGVKKNEQLFDISKIATLQPSKWPISHVFKNPDQGK